MKYSHDWMIEMYIQLHVQNIQVHQSRADEGFNKWVKLSVCTSMFVKSTNHYIFVW